MTDMYLSSGELRIAALLAEHRAAAVEIIALDKWLADNHAAAAECFEYEQLEWIKAHRAAEEALNAGD